MASFDISYAKTMAIEGEYVNNPNDNGGETYAGIARKFWPKWSGWAIIDNIKAKVGTKASSINAEAKIDSALQSLVKSFYKTNFWDVNKLDQVNVQAIADEIFDTGVNMGVVVAAKMLQQALNLCNKNGQSYSDIAEDGKIGPATLSVLNNKAVPLVIFNTLNLLQAERYLDIMRSNKSQEIFWTGWLKRILLS